MYWLRWFHIGFILPTWFWCINGQWTIIKAHHQLSAWESQVQGKTDFVYPATDQDPCPIMSHPSYKYKHTNIYSCLSVTGNLIQAFPSDLLFRNKRISCIVRVVSLSWPLFTQRFGKTRTERVFMFSHGCWALIASFCFAHGNTFTALSLFLMVCYVFLTFYFYKMGEYPAEDEILSDKAVSLFRNSLAWI